MLYTSLNLICVVSNPIVHELIHKQIFLLKLDLFIKEAKN